jgi:GT2 family glycosyltransferase
MTDLPPPRDAEDVVTGAQRTLRPPNFRPPWARIVIVAYRSGRYLQACVDALAAQSFGDFEAVIVDNHCPDDSVRMLERPDERFSSIRAPENLGFAGGSNLGAQGADAEWIITLNPDTRVSPDWLAELRSAAQRHPQFDMLGATLFRADDGETIDGFGDVLSVFGIAWRGGHGAPASTLPDEDVEVFSPCGAAAAYRREVFEKIGGFDPWYFCYLEDVDLAFRMRRAGCACLQVRRATVRHVGSGSSEPDGDFAFYQTYRNNLRLVLKNAPWLLAVVMAPLYGFAQAYILFRNRKATGARARYDGIRQAIVGAPQALRSRHENSRRIRELAPGLSGQRAAAPVWRRLAWRRQSLRTLEPVYWRI